MEKLLNYDHNTVWRRIRNNYIVLLWGMVARGKIDGVFLKMPPEKDIPNLPDEPRTHMCDLTVLSPEKEEQPTHEISIKKI